MSSDQAIAVRDVLSAAGVDQPALRGETGTLGGLWSIYYRRGYEDGRRQVVRDLLGALVTISEEFLKAKGQGAASNEPRKLVYAFEDYLERQIVAIGGEAGFVEGGLGI